MRGKPVKALVQLLSVTKRGKPDKAFHPLPSVPARVQYAKDQLVQLRSDSTRGLQDKVILQLPSVIKRGKPGKAHTQSPSVTRPARVTNTVVALY